MLTRYVLIDDECKQTERDSEGPRRQWMERIVQRKVEEEKQIRETEGYE